MAQYNPRNNGSTAHLFGTTAKMPRLSEPPAAERAMPRQPAAPMAVPMTPTFAQMQSDGRARPAAPAQAPFMGNRDANWNMPMPSSGMGRTSSMSSASGAPPASGTPAPAPQNPILQQLGQTLAGRGTTPSRFDTDLYKRLRDQALGDLEADFGARRQMLDEEMARRGLYSSSLAGGRLGDLEGQYARARGGIETDLLARAAETQMQDRIARDQMMMQLAQMLSGMKASDRNKFLAQISQTQG